MSDTTIEIPQDGKVWGGGSRPLGSRYGKLMMWFFLVSDALTFSGLLIAYGFTRHDAQDAWPIGEETFKKSSDSILLLNTVGKTFLVR